MRTEWQAHGKINQLVSIWLNFDPEKGEVAPSAFITPEVEYDMEYYLDNGVGQITRPFGSQPIDPVKGAEMVNTLQKRLVENTRLGIPARDRKRLRTRFPASLTTLRYVTSTPHFYRLVE